MTGGHPLVVVTGHPGAGKTTLAEPLARLLDLPLLTKDRVKERLFDELGVGDRTWSARLGRASMAVLYQEIRQVLPFSGVVADANFREEHAGCPLRDAVAASGARVCQVVVDPPADVMLARLRARAASATTSAMTSAGRHPGHLDRLHADAPPAELASPCTPLDLPGPVLTVDGCGAVGAEARAVAEWVRRSLAR